MVILAQNYRQLLADGVLSLCLSLALYVLQAIGLYTLAKRRGNARPWLAWIPLGNLWILGSLSNDFRRRFPFRRVKLRTALMITAALGAAVSVLVLVLLGTVLLPALSEVIGLDLGELITVAALDPQAAMDMLQEMDVPQPDDRALEGMLASGMAIMMLSLAMTGLTVAAEVLEYICLYDLFTTCKPQYKVLFLVLSILFGVGGVLIFVFKNSDEGLPPEPAPWPQQPWPPQLP